LTPEEITAFIEAHNWRFARTMPHIPHSYVVRAQCRSAAEFERFVMHIRRHGYRQKFAGRTYTYLDVEIDGVSRMYWTMGAPLADTVVINRAVKPP
jgi:hypothetical protein